MVNGSLFLEKLVFVWVYFQIPLRHILTKTKLECPFGLQISFGLVEETYMVSMLFFTTNPSKLFRVRGVDVVKFEKKKIMPQNSLSLSERESVVVNEDVTFPRWPSWEFGMAKDIKHATISLRIVSNNYSSCQKSLNRPKIVWNLSRGQTL